MDKAWGENRYTWGDTPTSFQYTGQRKDAIIGLYFYNARYYDPALGRFVQADTIVPNPADPQSLNRYSYVYNNALRYVDPSGHGICDNPGGGLLNPDCQDYQSNGDHSSHERTHSLFAKLTHGVAELIHAVEGYHAAVHGAEMVRGGLKLVPGVTYAGQMIVYGTHEAKAAAGLSPYLIHARAATHSGLRPLTNPWAAAGKAVAGRATAVALGIVYGVDICEYHDDGTKLASAIVVDTGITLGPPAAGAWVGTAIAPGPGTAIGMGAGYLVSILSSLIVREPIIDVVDERIITPIWEGLEQQWEWQLQTGGSPQWPDFTSPYEP